MLIKTIEIDGRPVTFRASASIPRMYRIKFGRDILMDLQRLRRAYLKNKKLFDNTADTEEVETAATEEVEKNEVSGFDVVDLEIFENVAYIMAKHSNNSTPSDIETWLDEFNMFSIYQILPTILELWAINEESAIESKKKLLQVAGK